jgi:hypothetical protein
MMIAVCGCLYARADLTHHVSGLGGRLLMLGFIHEAKRGGTPSVMSSGGVPSMCVVRDKRRAMQNVSRAVRLAGGSMSSSRDAEVKGGPNPRT